MCTTGVRISNPGWSCWAPSRAGSWAAPCHPCWMKRNRCQRLPSCSRAPYFRLLQGDEGLKAEADRPAEPLQLPKGSAHTGVFSRDTVQPQVRGIPQCCFLPQCQKFNFEAWSRFYLNSKLPFEDVLVIFNQIAEAIHSKTHETFKSDFLPSRNSHTTNTQFLWAGGIIG